MYIPWKLFREHYIRKAKQEGREWNEFTIKVAWYNLLDHSCRDASDWERLKKEYGRLIEYSLTNWTPRGRIKRISIVHP